MKNVKIWESFAGKSYVKPKKLAPGIIHDTVKEAQRLLCDADWSIYEQGCRDAFRDMGWMGPQQYPKSLGEICLEIREERQQGWVSRHPNKKPPIRPYGMREMVGLRQVMWHKKREPEPPPPPPSKTYDCMLYDPCAFTITETTV